MNAAPAHNRNRCASLLATPRMRVKVSDRRYLEWPDMNLDRHARLTPARSARMDGFTPRPRMASSASRSSASVSIAVRCCAVVPMVAKVTTGNFRGGMFL